MSSISFLILTLCGAAAGNVSLCWRCKSLPLLHFYASLPLALAIQSKPVTSCCPSTKLNCAVCS